MGKRSGIMLATPLEERRLTDPKFGWTFPCYVQPKLDGIRCIAKANTAGVYSLFSSENNGIEGLTEIEIFLDKLSLEYTKRFGSFDFVFDGELYNHSMTFEQISSGVKKYSPALSDKLEFHIFDYFTTQVTEKHSVVTDFSFRNFILQEKLALILSENVELARRLKIVPCLAIRDIQEMYMEFDRFIHLGYEGIIVRHPRLPYEFKRSLQMLKYKTKCMDYYPVVSYSEARSKDGTNLGRLGSLTLTDNEQNLFDVAASALTHKQSEFCFNYLNRIKQESLPFSATAVIGYQTLTEAKIPKFVGKLALVFYDAEMPILVIGSNIPGLTDLVMPKPERYGYVNSEGCFDSDVYNSGWVVDGGEEEYRRNLLIWQEKVLDFMGGIR